MQRRRGCDCRADHGQGLPGDQDRPREGGPLRGQRRRHPGHHRGGPGRPGHHADGRRPRPLPGARPLRPRLPRGRGGRQAPAGERAVAGDGRAACRGDGRTGLIDVRAPDATAPSRGGESPHQVSPEHAAIRRSLAGPAWRSGRRARRRRAGHDQERERPAAQLRHAERSRRPRHRRFRGRGPAGRGREGDSCPRACTSNGAASSSTRSGQPRRCGSSSRR